MSGTDLLPLSKNYHLLLLLQTLLTVSDSLVTNEETTAEEREKTFTAMMEVALEIA